MQVLCGLAKPIKVVVNLSAQGIFYEELFSCLLSSRLYLACTPRKSSLLHKLLLTELLLHLPSISLLAAAPLVPQQSSSWPLMHHLQQPLAGYQYVCINICVHVCMSACFYVDTSNQ